MKQLDFLFALHDKLSCLPQEDASEYLNFYSEMIADRMEDGLSEEDAVASVGSVEEIAAQIIADTPLSKLAKAYIKPKRRLTAWEIVLLALGFPIWFSLLVAAFAVVFSLWVSLWAVIVSLWASFVAVAAYAFGAVAAGIGFIAGGSKLSGIATIGTGIVCAGLAIFLFFGCKAATKGAAALTKKIALGIKKCFMKKEAA